MVNYIGKKIRQIRLLSGFSQENVAEELGMSHGNYGKIERGEIDITSSHLIKLANILNVKVGDFFIEDLPSTKPTSNFGENSFPYGFVNQEDFFQLQIEIQKIQSTLNYLIENKHKMKNNSKKSKSKTLKK